MVNVGIIHPHSERSFARPEWRRAAIQFALLAGILALLYRDAFLSMASIWMTSSVYHHGLFAAPISVWLIVRRQDWLHTPPTADRRGVFLIAAASILWLFARSAAIDLIAHFAFVASIVGAVITVYGCALTARWAFALGFLFFMVPFGEELTPMLQGVASVAIAATLNLSDVETARDGFMLTTSAGRFEVAASCAGLRFLLASAMVSSLVAHLAFEHWRKQAAFVALALFAALLANWLRAYLIVALATLTERRIGVGPEHVALGWTFYSVIIVAMIALARQFADRQGFQRIGAPANEVARRSNTGVVVAAIAAASFAAIYDGAVLSSPKSVEPPSILPSLAATGFDVAPSNSLWRAHVPGADIASVTEFRSDESAVVVTLAYFTHDRTGAEIAGAETRAADGENWRRIAVTKRPVSVTGASRQLMIETLEDKAGRKIEAATLYWLGNSTFQSAAGVKLAVAARKLTGRPTEGGVVYVAAMHGANDDPQAAIEQFLNSMEPLQNWRQTIERRD